MGIIETNATFKCSINCTFSKNIDTIASCQVKRPQRDNDFHGVLDGKTLVTWEVKPLASGSDGIRPVQMSEMATQLTSPKRRLHLKLCSNKGGAWMVMIYVGFKIFFFYFW